MVMLVKARSTAGFEAGWTVDFFCWRLGSAYKQQERQPGAVSKAEGKGEDEMLQSDDGGRDDS